MRSRTILAMLVGALAVAAGCLGGVSVGGDAPGTTADGSGPGPVAEDPEALLTAAGSFTSEWRTTVSDGETGESSDVAYTYAVDLENERYLVTLRSAADEGSAMEYYYADGVTYTKVGDGEDAFYTMTRGEEGFDLSAAFVTDAYYYGHHDADWMERVGTETFDGVAVTRYEGTEGWLARVNDPGDGRPGYTVSGSKYVTLVDADGLVRYDAWSVTMTDDDGTEFTWGWEASVTKVGATTVTEPDWVELARARGTTG